MDRIEDQKQCDHEDLVFQESEVHGTSIFEDYVCQECGAVIVFVYEEPDTKFVEYDGGSSEEIKLGVDQ